MGEGTSPYRVPGFVIFIIIAGVWSLGGSYLAKAAGTQSQRKVPMIGLSFSIYALSRGSGVPTDARRVLQETREVFSALKAQGVKVETVENRIGLEGERRLCATFVDDEAAAAAWQKISTIVDGVDLINVRVETCTK